jgi:hypothetical protein
MTSPEASFPQIKTTLELHHKNGLTISFQFD